MSTVEIPNWLKRLPFAPEFRPTDTEFADPIAYISRIEKEASAFGICKIIPPLPKPSKKYVFHNLNKSLLKSPELGHDATSSHSSSASKTGSGDSGIDREIRAVFTTRHQELGQNVKKLKGAVRIPQLGVNKQVWQSGEIYTLEQFESKSKAFMRSLLGAKEVSSLSIEAMFWKAASEKPIYVEYANDVPGSAFGEPESQFQYFHRRRRKRNFFRRSSDFRRKETSTCTLSRHAECKDTTVKNEPNTCTETSKISKSINDMEGTAGWKLSNSPWNLQVIARSPGSLTRFMPDDIPGVTSPMVYIGMLFSWFAWHVEDHELHSMNFLHTGAPKTWYSVPGDYAFAFEEAVRTEAYGSNIDHLAALKLLGEKTTLLSPEIVVASGIPCCRLIQYPGEFVVTFPRAYHVGFSHGFNCGEAANFGTPDWLRVAKEAAVRRAAMNYLPMLSHQQLLYLLTMSFISRVPRSLLPGVRSSRLRDRLKEEREFSVKKGFVEDILRENSVLSILLGKETSSRVVLWNPDLLPFSSKDPRLPSSTPAVDNVSLDKNETVQNDLFDEMSLYMENLNDLYLEADDLSCDFQVDSGTLACVACGILGFPFMTVVQPSEKASQEIFDVDQLLVPEGDGSSRCENTRPSLSGSVLEGPPHVPDVHPSSNDESLPSITKFDKGWNTSCKFLRPRSFCLEHAVEIVDLLQSKGGANVLVICHSDYQKIKAHAAAIAEEIGSPFRYNEVPLETASQQDLKLIDHAVDDDGHDECGGDWTSRLGINLRYCIKIRKNSPSMQVQHAFRLGGLFPDTVSGYDFSSTTKWQSRRSRSNKKKSPPVSKQCETVQIKKDEVLQARNEGETVRKKEKVIQYYSRKKSKLKSSGSNALVSETVEDHSMEEMFVDSETCKLARYTCKMQYRISGNDEMNEKSGISDGKSELNHDKEVMDGCGENNGACNVASEGELQVVEGRNVLINESDTAKPTGMHVVPEMNDASVQDELEDNQANGSSVEECPQVTGGSSTEENLANISISNAGFQELQTENKNKGEEAVSCFGAREQNGHIAIEISGLDNEVEQKSQILNEGDQDPVSKYETPMSKIEDQRHCTEVCTSKCNIDQEVNMESNPEKPRKRKRKLDQISENLLGPSSFIKSPCEGLRPRARKSSTNSNETDVNVTMEEKPVIKKKTKKPDALARSTVEKEVTKGSHRCDLEGCKMSFETKGELLLHKRNQCLHEGCGKKFSSHKYAVLHQRVHDDERPLKCPWEGCSMSFKWAWARTEHIRVHTGERPYMCQFSGCGLSFRFVSDFSRHRRKTGHYVDQPT